MRLPILVLVIALAAHLYALGTFPYFPVASPWNGAATSQASLKGLYSDEYNYLQIAQGLSQNPPQLPTYQPPLALLVLDASITALGVNVFAVRLPFAVFSSLTAVFVYLISKRLAGLNVLGLASALIYVAMVPALVYGRMAFLDNVSAFFFVAMFYFLLRFRDEKSPTTRNRWLLVAGMLGGLSVLSKITGLVSIIFILLFLYQTKELRRSVRQLLPTLFLVAIFPLIVFLALNHDPTKFASLLSQQYGIFQVGNEIGTWRYFLFETLPSGFTAAWGGAAGFPIPEFWYVILYVTLAAVAIREFPAYSDLILAISVLFAFDVVVVRLGSYFLVFLQPLLAVSFGPGIRHLVRMPAQATLGVFTFLYAPLAVSLAVTVLTGQPAGTPFISDPLLFLWKFLLVLLPLAILFLYFRRYQEDLQWRARYNAGLLAMLIIILLVASYLTPDLYSQYFFRGAFVP